MKHPKMNMLLAFVFIVAYNFSCKKENLSTKISTEEQVQSEMLKNAGEEKYNVFKGPQVSLGNGKVRSWVKISHENKPMELGVEFTPAALTGLTEHGYGFLIPLHQKAKEATPYNHVYMRWNPNGHPPPGIFTAPHFDPHFMRISNEERLAIPAYTPGSAFDILPAPAYRPVGYIPLGGEAQMGLHWGAMPFPAPGTFTRVLIYGSYDGKMIFEEPMVTLQHMLNGGSAGIPFGQPQLFHSPGNYPTEYNVYTSEDGHYHISLSKFVAR